jgi:acetyltransferase
MISQRQFTRIDVMTIDIRRFTARDIRTHQNELIELLRDVVDGGASVNFIAPLDESVAAAYWDRIAGEVDGGGRIVLVALDGDRVVGCVHLALAMQPNGLHRAEVQKVLTHSRARRQGIARRLMQAIEGEARAAKRTLLVLDTVKDSPAQALYEQVGYQRVGVIPQFASDSSGSVLIDATFFYKLLN